MQSRWKQFQNNYWFTEMESRLYKGVTSWLLFFFRFNFLHFFHFNECIFEWIESKKKKQKNCASKWWKDQSEFDFNAIEIHVLFVPNSCLHEWMQNENIIFFYFSNSCSTKNLFVCRKLDLCFFFRLSFSDSSTENLIFAQLSLCTW